MLHVVFLCSWTWLEGQKNWHTQNYRRITIFHHIPEAKRGFHLEHMHPYTKVLYFLHVTEMPPLLRWDGWYFLFSFYKFLFGLWIKRHERRISNESSKAAFWRIDTYSIGMQCNKIRYCLLQMSFLDKLHNVFQNNFISSSLPLVFFCLNKFCNGLFLCSVV